MSKTFDYKDINLIPKLCIVKSRSECSTKVSLGRFVFELPIIPANMECVIDQTLAENLASENYFYILHRFNVDVKEFMIRMKKLNLFTSISVGVTEESYKLLDELVVENLIPDFITIDIAHGHSLSVRDMIYFIRNSIPNKKVFIICGNVSTPEAVRDLIDWGSDCIKVGIGPGSACTTYPTTGFGSRDIQGYCIEQCSKTAKASGIPIIADGGISTTSDIAKALVLGATFVMIGGMLSGFKDSPGNIIKVEGKLYKEFYGSASSHSYTSDGKKKIKNIEGVRKIIPYKEESVLKYYDHIRECLQSAISYGGGNNLNALKGVKYVIKTN